jgi:hypothetical protein
MTDNTQPVPVEEVEIEVAEVCDRLLLMEINDGVDYDRAGNALLEIKDNLKRVDEVFEPMRAATYKAYQEVMSQKKGLTEPLELANTHIRDLMRDYVELKEFERKQAEKQAIEAARKQAELDREKELEAPLKKGDEDKAEALVAAPITIKPSEVVVKDEIPHSDRVSYREVWSGELLGESPEEQDRSLRELCKAIGAGAAPLSLVTVNTRTLNALAKSLKNDLRFPGVKAVCRKTTVVR